MPRTPENNPDRRQQEDAKIERQWTRAGTVGKIVRPAALVIASYQAYSAVEREDTNSAAFWLTVILLNAFFIALNAVKTDGGGASNNQKNDPPDKS